MDLMKAVKHGFISQVQVCLDRGDRVDIEDASGYTPMHYAAAHGHAYIVDLLAKHGANLNQGATKFKLSPLHLAVCFNQVDVIETLLELGADIDIPSEQGMSPLILGLKIHNVTHYFDDLKLELDTENKIRGKNPAKDSICLLLNKGCILEDPSLLESFVYDCLINDNLKGLKASVDRGFKLRKLDSMEAKLTGFHEAELLAASNFSIQCLKYLAEKNPDFLEPLKFSLSGSLRSSFLQWVTQQMPTLTFMEFPKAFLDAQSDHDSKQINIQEFIPNGIDKDSCFVEFDSQLKVHYLSSVQNGLCVLHFDSKGNLKDHDNFIDRAKQTLEFLIEKGENLNHEDKEQDRPCHYLAHCPFDLIKIFVDLGMKFRGVELQKAIQTNTPEVVRLLLKAGAQVGWENKEGKNALQVLDGTDNWRMDDERYQLLILLRECLDKENAEQKMVTNHFLPSYSSKPKIKESSEKSNIRPRI